MYYEALTNLILLENVPGRLEMLMKPVLDRISMLYNAQQFNESECVLFYFRSLSFIADDCERISRCSRDCSVLHKPAILQRIRRTHVAIPSRLNRSYPKAFDVMQRALREHGNEEEIVSSIMKFLSSLVLNQESRIDYCNDIANGVTLFRETARVLIVYGNLLLNNFKAFVGNEIGSQCRINVLRTSIKASASSSM